MTTAFITTTAVNPHCAAALSPGVRAHLTTAALAAYAKDNPHCGAVVPSGRIRARLTAAMLCRPMYMLPLTLAADAARLPYHRTPEHERTTLHNGQLKLFLGELALLCRFTSACADTPYTIVYAGAAPGHHIPLLARMFARCRFILYDPAPFCEDLRQARRAPPNVEVHQAFFTEETAAELAAKHAHDQLLFVCDIRTGKDETYVQADMERQYRWALALRALVTSLKFRLPWGAGATPYFDGTIALQAYPPTTSTETRLIVRRADLDAPLREYDNLAYEERLAYHNTVGRVCGYAHGVTMPGLDSCYDCAAFVATATAYLSGRGLKADAAAVTDLMRQVTGGLRWP